MDNSIVTNNRVAKLTQILISALTIFIFFYSVSLSSAQQGSAVVLDLAGEVTLISEFDGFEDESPLRRTESLARGNRIVLASGSSVVLMNFTDYQRYSYKGPGEILITADGFQSKDDKELVLNPSNINSMVTTPLSIVLGVESKSYRLPVSVIGIRDLGKKQVDISLVSPVDWERVLSKHPEFNWLAVIGAVEYRFVLKDKSGAILVDTAVKNNRTVIPNSVKLADGAIYTWSVSVTNNGVTLKSPVWSMQITTAKEREEISRLLPSKNSPISEHVLYAIVLEKLGIMSAAKKQWRVLQGLRSSDRLFRSKAK
jgi:hypothetical protein